MNSELKKSLVDLIDETLGELEELKKSRFSAVEVKLDGPGADGIAGKPANGDLGKDEDKKEDEDEEEEKEEDEDDMDKAEGKNSEADPNAGRHKADQMDKAEGKNCEADPNAGRHKADQMVKKDDEEEEDEEDKEDKKEDMKKSLDEVLAKSRGQMESLMKSFVDERIAPLEDKLSTIVDLVNKLADQPVAPKGYTARAVPLMKSADEGVQPLSKSELSNKLFELKKSGTKVDSLDVAKAEMGQDLESIVKKYNI